MSRKFLTALDLSKNELQNAVVQNLAGAPSSPVKGQLYYDSTGNILYWHNGTTWVSAAGGSVAFGAITAETAFGGAKADGVATTAARSDHAHGNPLHDDAAHSTIKLNSFAAPNGPVSMGGFRITNVATPTTGTDAANKDYVDNGIAGLSWKEAVRIATTGNVTQSGLTAIDGVTPIANDRILCKDQSTGAQNGIWLAQSGAWTRATDADAVGELEGAVMFVTEGTVSGDTAWTCTTNGAITPGTTATTWTQFGNTTIAVDSVDNTKLANMPANTIKGNDTGATADPKDLTKVAFAAMFAGTLARVTNFAIGAGTSAVLNHAFNTKFVVVEVYRTTTPWDTIDCDVERTDANNVTVRFAAAVGASEYTAVIMG